MSYCKNYAIRCDECGLFCIVYDEETPFGCSNYDPPEPHDPYHYCKKCSKILYEKWLKDFRDGRRHGYWHKSDAERKAAKECGLIWVDSGGIGKFGTKEWKLYRYVTKEEHEKLSGVG